MVVCEACGTSVVMGRFCNNCGTNLRSAAEPSTARPAELRHLTVLFCDLVGSSALAETLDPEQYAHLLSRYQAACSGVVTSYDGYVAQYLGDGILIYFGYPTAHEDDPRRAILAALDILRTIARTGIGAAPNRQRISVRIGIHTGMAVAGEVGTGVSRESLALGHAPNVAARLQAEAEPDTIVISGTLKRLVEGFFDCKSLGWRTLPGMSEATELFTVAGELTHSRFAGVASKGLTPFVARDTEIALLDGLWEDTTNGKSVSVLIRGEAGIGKSRLTRRITERVADSLTRSTICECSPFHGNSVLFPVIEMLKRQIQRRPSPSMAEDDLGALEHFVRASGLEADPAVALLGALLDIPLAGRYEVPVMGPELQREETLKLLLKILRRSDQPHVVVFEDLQWADATTMELVHRLVAESPTPGLMVVMNCRPELELAWIASAGTRPLELPRLNDDELKTPISPLDSGNELAAEVIDAIVRSADGVPLYAEELAKSVLESEIGHQNRKSGTMPGWRQLQLVPDTLQDSMVARLDRLGYAKEIAQHAAVIGRNFQLPLLLSIVNMPEAELLQGLERLIDAGIMVEHAPGPYAAYQFNHALVQLAAYGSLLRGPRQHLHGRIVQSIESNFKDISTTQPELLAYHCELSGLVEKAIDYWMSAGQRAFAKSANVEAGAHFRKARTLLADLPDGDQRRGRELAVLSMLGPALIATAGFASQEVGEVYDVARSLCEASPENPATFPAMWGSWVFFLVKGKLGSSRSFAERMLALGESTGNTDLLIEARWALGNSHYWLGEMEPARAQLEKAIAAYDPERHRSHALLFGQDPGVAAHCYLSFVYWMLGRPQDSAAALASASSIAEALDHPFTTAWPMAFQILLSSHDHDPQTGLVWAERLIRFSEEQKQQYWLQAAIIIRGWSLAGLGELTEGVKEMRRGIASYTATGAGVSLPHFYGLLAETLVDAARYEEADQILDLAFDHARSNMERASEVNLWRIKANLLRARDRSASMQVIEYLGTALRIAEHCAAWAPGLRAAAALHRSFAEHRPDMLQSSPLPRLLNRFPSAASSRYLMDARALVSHST